MRAAARRWTSVQCECSAAPADERPPRNDQFSFSRGATRVESHRSPSVIRIVTRNASAFYENNTYQSRGGTARTRYRRAGSASSEHLIECRSTRARARAREGWNTASREGSWRSGRGKERLHVERERERTQRRPCRWPFARIRDATAAGLRDARYICMYVYNILGASVESRVPRARSITFPEMLLGSRLTRLHHPSPFFRFRSSFNTNRYTSTIADCRVIAKPRRAYICADLRSMNLRSSFFFRNMRI